MTPDTVFRCVPLACTMAVRHCLNRRAVKTRFGSAVYPACAVCPLGMEVAAQVEGFTPMLTLRPHRPPRPKSAPVVREPKPPKLFHATCYCGNHIAATKPTTYCSHACANKRLGLLRRAKPGLAGKKCELCGKELMVKVNSKGHIDRWATKRRRFCSRTCGGKKNGRNRWNSGSIAPAPLLA